MPGPNDSRGAEAHPAGPLGGYAPGMEMLTAALIWLLAMLSIGCGLYWLVVAGHVIHARWVLPTLRKGLSLPAPEVPVCVIVPAHNEEGTIGKLVASLREQDYEHLHVLLALDRCTDSTAQQATDAIGGDSRFTVIEIDECPDGWSGKVHALWHTVQRAPQAQQAEALLFIDADTSMHPGCIRSAMALMEQRGDDLLSVLSSLEVRSWYEMLSQAAACFVLTVWYPPVRASREHRRRPFANGQFLLFRRSAYDTVGGHESMVGHLLEDMEFARRIDASGLRTSVLFSAGLHKCRMYPTWDSYSSGWRRIYVECAKRKVSRLRAAAVRLIVTAALLPALALACLWVVPWAGWVGLAGFGVGLAAVAWGGGISPLAIAAFPVGALMMGQILFSAAANLKRRVPTRWGGNTYIREPR